MPIPLSPKQAAISAAKQVARESNEILRTAGQQILSTPEVSQPQSRPQSSESVHNTSRSDVDDDKAAKESRLKNLMSSYDSELNQIRRENLFKELQRKIAEGEEIAIEDYATELGSEQREVLKAQQQAVKMQKESAMAQPKESPFQIISKRARGMIGTVKKRNQQHVESQKMPSN